MTDGVSCTDTADVFSELYGLMLADLYRHNGQKFCWMIASKIHLSIVDQLVRLLLKQ